MLGSDGRQQHTVFKVGFKHLKALKSLLPVVFGKGLKRGGINMNSKISEVSKCAAGDEPGLRTKFNKKLGPKFVESHI